MGSMDRPRGGAYDCGTMRLSEAERRALRDAIAVADPDAEVWLHGSRVRDDAMGGDIDLVVVSRRIGLREKLDVLARLHAAVGERRIDLTVARDDSRPFVRLAMAHGVRL
jgi:predicted nucleotidyltransferase